MFLVGMGSKWLRVYDLRMDSTSAPASVINTRAVYGIQADPFVPFRVASYSVDDGGMVMVWDLRKTTITGAGKLVFSAVHFYMILFFILS
jgi:hypothetical protein